MGRSRREEGRLLQVHHDEEYEDVRSKMTIAYVAEKESWALLYGTLPDCVFLEVSEAPTTHDA